MSLSEEKVILVNERDHPIGQAPKIYAHLNGGMLHRAISVFVYSSRGEFLLQRRAPDKYHFGNLWSNTCCTHPCPGEGVRDAAQRRLWQEMGVSCDLEAAFVFAYTADASNGLTEREIDHVFIGEYDGEVQANRDEVAEFRWLHREILRQEVHKCPGAFTPWLIAALPRVLEVVQ